MNVTTTQTTKLIKVDTPANTEKQPIEEQEITEEHSGNSTDISDISAIEGNDTADGFFSNLDGNVTELAELSERRSKVLTGYNEVKVVNNISSRSTLQVTHQSILNNDKLNSEALFVTDDDNGGITMNAGSITGICFGVIGILSALSSMTVYVYRRRFLNKPQTLSEPDSSGYIDDSTIRVSNCLSWPDFILANNVPLSLSGQLRRNVQLGQRLVPEFVGGNDNTKLLDGQCEAHQVVNSSENYTGICSLTPFWMW